MTKIEAAELRSRRDRDRLKGNGETESFKRTELATNRQKKIKRGRGGGVAAAPLQSELRDGTGTV